MLGSATIGGEVGLYEPVHGSAPDIADAALPILWRDCVSGDVITLQRQTGS